MTFHKLDQVQDFSSAWLSTYKETSQGSLEQFLQSEVNAGGSKLWFCTLCSMAIFSPLPFATFLRHKLKNTAQLLQEPGI